MGRRSIVNMSEKGRRRSSTTLKYLRSSRSILRSLVEPDVAARPLGFEGGRVAEDPGPERVRDRDMLVRHAEGALRDVACQEPNARHARNRDNDAGRRRQEVEQVPDELGAIGVAVHAAGRGVGADVFERFQQEHEAVFPIAAGPQESGAEGGHGHVVRVDQHRRTRSRASLDDLFGNRDHPRIVVDGRDPCEIAREGGQEHAIRRIPKSMAPGCMEPRPSQREGGERRTADVLESAAMWALWPEIVIVSVRPVRPDVALRFGLQNARRRSNEIAHVVQNLIGMC